MGDEDVGEHRRALDDAAISLSTHALASA